MERLRHKGPEKKECLVKSLEHKDLNWGCIKMFIGLRKRRFFFIIFVYLSSLPVAHLSDALEDG